MSVGEPAPAIRELTAAVTLLLEAEDALRAALAKVDAKDASLNNYLQGFNVEDLVRISQAILNAKVEK